MTKQATPRAAKQAPRAAKAPVEGANTPQSAQQAPTATQVATAPLQGLHGGFELAALPKHIVKMGVGTPCSAKLATIKVKLGDKPFGAKATHCVQWWSLVTKTIASNAGAATYDQLKQAGVPAHFVSYVTRRGGLANA